MRACSSASGEAFVLRPEPSRLLRLWWGALHTTVGLAAWAVPLPLWARLAALGALAAHWARRGLASDVVEPIAFACGTWALPREGRHGLRLGPRARISDHWVALDLVPGGGLRILFRDQLPDEQWRRLNLQLRTCRKSLQDR